MLIGNLYVSLAINRPAVINTIILSAAVAWNKRNLYGWTLHRKAWIRYVTRLISFDKISTSFAKRRQFIARAIQRVGTRHLSTEYIITGSWLWERKRGVILPRSFPRAHNSLSKIPQNITMTGVKEKTAGYAGRIESD